MVMMLVCLMMMAMTVVVAMTMVMMVMAMKMIVGCFDEMKLRVWPPGQVERLVSPLAVSQIGNKKIEQNKLDAQVAHRSQESNSPLDPVLIPLVAHKTERIIRKSTCVGLVTTSVSKTQPHLLKDTT